MVSTDSPVIKSNILNISDSRVDNLHDDDSLFRGYGSCRMLSTTLHFYKFSDSMRLSVSYIENCQACE